MKIAIDNLHGKVYYVRITVDDNELSDEDARALREMQKVASKKYVALYEEVGESYLKIFTA